MAIVLNFNADQSDDGKTFSIIETTGIYSASNTGGWGTPNPVIGSSLISTITLYQLTDAGTGTYNDPVVINSYPTLPNVTNTVFNFTAQQSGYGENSIFPDAIYKLIYTVTGNNGSPYTYSKEKSFVFTHNIDCAVKLAANNVAICSCNCRPVINIYNDLMIQKRLMQAATCCGNTVQIFNYINLITNMINDLNCGCNG